MRIDKFLSEKYGSRTKAAEAIEKGVALVNGRKVNPSYEIKRDDELSFIEDEESFVSNGGYKLSKALKDFSLNVEGKIVADVGASNGGFTDCLFKNGAEKVYCIDVGESQLDVSLKDKNVVIMDNFNARNLSESTFPEKIDGVVIDVSFISLTYILKQVSSVLDDGCFVVALIKPQFECESKNVGKNGIVKDPIAHKKIIGKIYDFAAECNLTAQNLTNAPIKQGKNKEYLIYLLKGEKKRIPFEQLIKYVKL